MYLIGFFKMVLFMSQKILYVFTYQIQKLCDSFMCTFSEFTGQKRCVHTDLYVPAIRARMSDMCMNYPDVEFTMFKIVFCEILIMLGINLTTKTELLTRL